MRGTAWLPKKRSLLLISAIAISVIWFFNRPPAKVVPIGTVAKPITKFWVSNQGKSQALILVSPEGEAWQVRLRDGKFVCEQLKQLDNAVAINSGFFDIDKDGYPEFLRTEFDTVWVFKRKESVKGKIARHCTPPSDFPLKDRSQWVVWAKIKVDGYCPDLTFVTEPDPKQPKKVVAWVKESSSGGFLFVLSPDGQRLIPFNSGEWSNQDYWSEVVSVEDLDHDGICEIIARGRSYDRTSPGHIGIYKWDGRTYRLWWTSPRKGEYVLDAEICDLDGDGTKEIVAVLDLKGMSNLRALAVYRLEGKRFKKVAQCRLPDEPIPYPDLAAIMPTLQGSIIAIERSTDEILFLRYWKGKFQRVGWIIGITPVGCSKVGMDFFVSDEVNLRWLEFLYQRLPSKYNLFFLNIFGSEQRPITKVVSWDRKELRMKAKLNGALETSIGRGARGNWILLVEAVRWKRANIPSQFKPALLRYRLFFGANGRYRKIWQISLPFTEPSIETCPADLDGDGVDELVFVDIQNDKVRVFRVVED
jgi:hypothetical protein